MSKTTNTPTIEFTVHLAILHYRARITERLLTCIAQRGIGGAL